MPGYGPAPSGRRASSPRRRCRSRSVSPGERPEVSDTDQPFLTLHEIVRAAYDRTERNIWDYIVGATETETTARRNRHALDRVAFRPRVLRDVSEFGVPFFLSSVTKVSMEDVAAAAPSGSKVFQLYVRGDAASTDDYVRRARDSGYDAFCLTVDTAIYSRRERDIARRFVKPWRERAGGMDFQAALSWSEVRRLKDKHDVRLILKGIATAEDAEVACQHGVESIYVSNHGGRQLDHGRGTLDILPEIVAAVAGRAKIIVDGGFCRGTDIVKAMALGADTVGIGRLYCYGLAAAGTEGVRRVLELLEAEVFACLGLLGVNAFEELDRSYVCPAEAVTPPHVLSAFPLISLPVEQY